MTAKEMFEKFGWCYEGNKTYAEVTTSECQITLINKDPSDKSTMFITFTDDYEDRMTVEFSKEEAIALVALIKEQGWLDE